MTRDYQALHKIVEERRSIRSFREEPVPEDLIALLLEAARWAPSAGNRQAFRFLIVTRKETIIALSEAVDEAARHIKDNLRADAREKASTYLSYFGQLERAPVVLVAIYREGASPLSQDASSSQLDSDSISPARIAAISSVSAAVMNLLLAAHSLGLGACWKTGPLIAETALKQHLEVPRGWSIAALIPLGFPDEVPSAPTRRSVSRLIRRIE